MSIINLGNNKFTIKWADAFCFEINTGKGPIKYVKAVVAFVFGKTVTHSCLETYVSTYGKTSLASYVRDKKLLERSIYNTDPESIINRPQALNADGVQVKVTNHKQANQTLHQALDKKNGMFTHKPRDNDEADHSTDPQPRVTNQSTKSQEQAEDILSSKTLPDMSTPLSHITRKVQDTAKPASTQLNTKQKNPEPVFTTWISIANQLEDASGSDGKQVLMLDKEKYCINPLPKVDIGQNDHTHISEHESETAAYAFNVNLTVDTTVNTEFDVENDVQTDIASASSNISSEIDVAMDRYKEKPKTWRDFLEKDLKKIKKYHAQIQDAKNRCDNNKFDALYDNHRQGKMKYGPDLKNFKVMVSKKAAEKYHSIYCNGTPVDGYHLGQKCIIKSSRITRDNAHERSANHASVNVVMHDSISSTETMCFDDVPAGFIIIQSQTNLNEVYICFDENYCHPNSKSIPEKKIIPWSEDIVGLVPKFQVINRHAGQITELFVEGEDNYSYQNPPSEIPQDFQKLLKHYSDKIGSLWIRSNTDPMERPEMTNPSWNYQQHPIQKLANKKVNFVGDFDDKESLFKLNVKSQKAKLQYIAMPNLNFFTYESGMYGDHENILKMANITTQYVNQIAHKFFPTLAPTIKDLLSEERMKSHLAWTDENGDNSSHYCKALNHSSSTSACALRQYQNSRRFLDALISIAKDSGSSKELEEHLQLLLSMEKVKTELCTDDYEAFYEDPAGNDEEGMSFSAPKPAVPVIRSNLARGGLVLKPFRHPHAHLKESCASSFELGEMGYLEVTPQGSTRGYGAYDYSALAVCVPDNPKKWIAMNYNYHTDSLIPLSEKAFYWHYASNTDGGQNNYKSYLQIANTIHSRVLVKNIDSCSRPKRIITTGTNDIFGTNGLNIMSWPGMRHCALRTKTDSTRWKALLKEETALLKRYKALSPRGRSMAFEQALSFSNAKKQPYTDPQKIKNALDSAIYVTNIAIDAANGNEDEAAKLLLPIRHLTHIHMPGARMTDRQHGSLESRRVNMVNYIRTHKDPREGIINLGKKLINDPSASFLVNGLLEKETAFLLEQPNTFLVEEMALHDKQTPFFIKKVTLDKTSNKVELDSEIKTSSESGHIDITEYLYEYHTTTELERERVNQELDSIVKPEEDFNTIHQCRPFRLLKKSDNKVNEMIDHQYLDKDKVISVCELTKNNVSCNLDTLFNLNMSRMKQKAESDFLQNAKKDAQILKDLTTEPKNKFNVQIQQKSNDEIGRPHIFMKAELLNLTNVNPDYVVEEGRKETKELEKAASEMTGALLIATSDKNNFTDLLTIGCAKAVALRALSTATYRPAAHTCVDGINSMTRSTLFQTLPAETQFDALCYTTAALTQQDCQVNNQYDFGLWEILARGELASPNAVKFFVKKEKQLKNRLEEIQTIREKLNELEQIVDSYHNQDSNRLNIPTLLAKNEEFKTLVKFMNNKFQGLNLDENNVDAIFSTCFYDLKSDIFLKGVNLYPPIPSSIEKYPKKVQIDPLSNEAKDANLAAGDLVHPCASLNDRLLHYKNELTRLSEHYKKEKQDKPVGYPSTIVTEMFMGELKKLQSKNVFLPLQDLKTAAKEIACENKEKCIALAQKGNKDELGKFIALIISKIAKKREQDRRSRNVLKDKFASHLKSEDIVNSILELTPIKDKQKCENIQIELNRLLASKDIKESKQKIEDLEKQLKTLKMKNGLTLTDTQEIRRQVNKLEKYTQEIIEKGVDSIAADYRHLIENSNGCIDDKLKVIGMSNIVFALNNKMSLPKESQVAALMASINSPSKNQAIGAEPGSGKSIYFIPACIITNQLGKKGEHFPIFVTNNETLLQQDYENFRPWGKAFNLSVHMLNTNFENNMKKYTTERGMVFGTAETVMGDRLRLDTLDLVDRFIGNDNIDEMTQCPNDQLLDVYTEGFKRGIVFDEYDTVKDKDCSGALIISETSTKQSDNWKMESYSSFFRVFEALETTTSTWQDYRDEMIKKLTDEMANVGDQKRIIYQSEIGKIKSMDQEDWNERIDSLRNFMMKKHQFKLQKTYTIGYETFEKGSSSKKTMVSVPNPTKAVIEEHLAQGHVLKILPINQTTAEMVRNASFADNASNYLAYMHGLPPSPPSRVLASASAQSFFENNFGKHGMYTLTATYGSGEMLDDLIPEGITNIFYKAPYKLDLVNHTPQVFESQTEIYDNVVNMAGHYIEQGMDVIILSSEQADVFALDRALGLYSQANKDFKEKSDVLTLANLQEKPDHQIFEEEVQHLNTPFNANKSGSRQRGSVINATDAFARGFNFKACNAVLISVGCPASERAKMQKYRRVGRKGNKGIVHSVMKQDVLAGNTQQLKEADIENHGGRHSLGIENSLNKLLLSKDAFIARRALVRNKIQTVIMDHEHIFMPYYQYMKLLEALKQAQLPMTKKMSDTLGGVVKHITPGTAERALNDWYQWRDNFVQNATKQCKTSEEADTFISKQMGEKKIWHDFITKQPFYNEIINADFFHKPKEMPYLPKNDTKKDRALHNTAILANKLHQKLHTAIRKVQSASC